MSVRSVLYENPWINYNDTLLQSRLILTWPKNVIFAAQLFDQISSLDVYKLFPFAERMDIDLFQKVNWNQSVIVIDADSQIVHAPEPVRYLVQLDHRLRFAESFDKVFGPFRVTNNTTLITWILLIIFIVWSIAAIYTKLSLRPALLVLTSNKV